MARRDKNLPDQGRTPKRKSANPYRPGTSKTTPAVSAPPSNDDDRFTWSVSAFDHEHSDGWDWDLKPAELHKESLQVQTEQMFRLRLNSDARVWGYVQRATFHVIWYDRDHQVCPVGD